MPTSLFSPDNGRVFWACQAVVYKERQSTTSGGDEDPDDGILLHGVQSVGVDSSFERTSYSDFGRFQREYGSYGKQIFTITIERVIDGISTGEGRGKPFYSPASNPSNYQNSHILKSNNIGADGFSGNLRNYDITLLYGGDSFRYMGSGGDDPAIVPPYVTPPQNWESATGPAPYNNPQAGAKNKVSQTTYRCCLLTEISYSIPVQGPVTESLTFVTGVATHNDEDNLNNYSALDDYPEGGHVDRIAVTHGRHIDTGLCVFPLEVERLFNMGQVKKGIRPGESLMENIPILGLQSIEMGMSIDYTDLFDYGEFGGTRGTNLDTNIAKQNFMKQVVLPVSVTASFSGVIRDQYFGDTDWRWLLDDQTLDNTATGDMAMYKWNREIAIYGKQKNSSGTQLYMNWLLGTKNYLTDLSYSGGDTGGGNVEATLSYQNEHSDFITYKSGTKYGNPAASDIY